MPGRDRPRRDAELLEKTLAPLPAPVERPAFVIMSGLPGTGKSHVAREIARRYPLAVLHIDALRKALFPRPAYTQEEHARTFAAVHALIDRLLSRGVSVLYDATNLKEEHRRILYDIGERNRARIAIVRVVSDDAIIRERLRTRRSSPDATLSDATEEVFEVMRRGAEPIQRPHTVVDATGDVSAAVDKIVGSLTDE